MPRPCAVEFHACSYRTKPHNCRRCHGLAPWSFTLAATEQNLTTVGDATALRRGVSRLQLQNKTSQLSEMPRPCAVEFHACSYRTKPHNCRRYHGLAPWSFTLAATEQNCTTVGGATALRRGVSHLSSW